MTLGFDMQRCRCGSMEWGLGELHGAVGVIVQCTCRPACAGIFL